MPHEARRAAQLVLSREELSPSGIEHCRVPHLNDLTRRRAKAWVAHEEFAVAAHAVLAAQIRRLLHLAHRASGTRCSHDVLDRGDDSHGIVHLEKGTGCVACLAGQYDCQGDKVMQCDDLAHPPRWEQIDVCNPSGGQACDVATGTCVVLAPTGGTEPTGKYYQYAYFTHSDGFQGGYDVDTWKNRIYVTKGSAIDVYDVELLDSDGGGILSPDQHPDNPDRPGPIEDRVLQFVETIPWGDGIRTRGPKSSRSEIGSTWAATASPNTTSPPGRNR